MSDNDSDTPKDTHHLDRVLQNQARNATPAELSPLAKALRNGQEEPDLVIQLGTRGRGNAFRYVIKLPDIMEDHFLHIKRAMKEANLPRFETARGIATVELTREQHLIWRDAMIAAGITAEHVGRPIPEPKGSTKGR